ncbi:MAG: carboxymuconolactone decarboxylase family protein [Betaproteobacteria bacterium]
MTERLNYLAASPRGIQAFGGVHLYIEKSGLPTTLVNLVNLRISQVNGCGYCISTYSRDLMKEGVPVQKLLLLPAGLARIRRPVLPSGMRGAAVG